VSRTARVSWGVLLAALVLTLVLVQLSEGSLLAAGTLGGAALWAAWVQQRRTGPWAPLWIATFLLAGASGPRFWGDPELALVAAGLALGLGLVFRRELPDRGSPRELWDVDLQEPAWRFLVRWTAVGALVGLPMAARPAHLLLVLALLPAVPHRRRRSGLAALAMGSVLGAGLGRTLSLGALAVSEPVTVLGPAWPLEQPALFLLDLFYLFLGSHVGILIAFPAVLLLLFGFEGGRLSWSLLGAALVIPIVAVIRHPFDFWDGGASVEVLLQRWWLAVYPAIWFLPSRHARPLPVAVPLLAIALLVPRPWAESWVRPVAPQLADRIEAGVETPVVRFVDRWLPVETTQRYLTPSGLEDRRHAGLWLRRLDRAAVVSDSVLAVRSGRVADFLVGHETPLDVVVVRVSAPAPSSVMLDGAEVSQLMLSPDGSVAFELALEPSHVRHPTWWTGEPVSFYRLRLLLPVEDAASEHTLRFSRGGLLEGAGVEEAP
jgi:hypothetical protein